MLDLNQSCTLYYPLKSGEKEGFDKGDEDLALEIESPLPWIGLNVFCHGENETR